MEFFGVSVFDLTVLGVISLSVLIGLVTGFVRPALFIIAWLVAALAALLVFPHAEQIAAGLFSQEWVIKVTAGLVPFLIVLAIFSIVGHTIAQKVQKSGLGNVDRALGAIVGVAVGSLILGVAYIGLDSYFGEDPYPDWVEEAVAQPFVEEAAGIARTLIPYGALDDPIGNFSDVTDAVGDVRDGLGDARPTPNAVSDSRLDAGPVDDAD